MSFYKKRKKRNVGIVQSLDTILPAVGKALNLDHKIEEWSLLDLWGEVVDEKFKLKTKAFRVKTTSEGNHLQVYVIDSIVASELYFYCELYKERLNQYNHQTGIKIYRINLHVRPDKF